MWSDSSPWPFLPASSRQRVVLQFGRMEILPASYTGERHVAVVSCVPDENGRDSFESEERPGPAPPGVDDDGDSLADPRPHFTAPTASWLR